MPLACPSRYAAAWGRSQEGGVLRRAATAIHCSSGFRTLTGIGRGVAARNHSDASLRRGMDRPGSSRPADRGSTRAPARDLCPPARGGRSRRRHRHAGAWRRYDSSSAARGGTCLRAQPGGGMWTRSRRVRGMARRLLPRGLVQAVADRRHLRPSPIGPYGPRLGGHRVGDAVVAESFSETGAA
jgi:hypothetical protein